MNVKNTPFDMTADDVTLLGMARLRGSGKLNDKNVDCFIMGYTACMEALNMPERLIPVLKHHYNELSSVRQKILDHIGYADLRRGISAEESEQIKTAEEVAGAIKVLIEILENKYAI